MSEVIVETIGPCQWRVRVERHCKTEMATGDVVVEQVDAPDPENAPHVAAAGGRAWLALGEKLLAAGDAESAIRCAQAGLGEVGTDYASPLVVDDTKLKLLAAKDRIETGHIADGAWVMLKVLKTRLALYAKLHASTLVK